MAALQQSVGGLQLESSASRRSFADVLAAQPSISKNSSPHPYDQNPLQMGLHKGKPAAFFTDLQLQSLSTQYSWSLVGKFSQGYNKEDPKKGRPSLAQMHQYFISLDFKGEFSLGLLDNRHIIIHLSNESDYLRLYSRMVWYIGSVTMRVFRWSPYFRVDKESPLVPVWITMPRLPIMFFEKRTLFSLASLIGRPLRIDDATASLKRPSVARIQVEVDLLKSRPDQIWIGLGDHDGYWQKIEYEFLPNYCQHCWHVGHSKNVCHVNNPDLKYVSAGAKESREPKLQIKSQPQHVYVPKSHLPSTADTKISTVPVVQANPDVLGKNSVMENSDRPCSNVTSDPMLVQKSSFPSVAVDSTTKIAVASNLVITELVPKATVPAAVSTLILSEPVANNTQPPVSALAPVELLSPKPLMISQCDGKPTVLTAPPVLSEPVATSTAAINKVLETPTTSSTQPTTAKESNFPATIENVSSSNAELVHNDTQEQQHTPKKNAAVATAGAVVLASPAAEERSTSTSTGVLFVDFSHLLHPNPIGSHELDGVICGKKQPTFKGKETVTDTLSATQSIQEKRVEKSQEPNPLINDKIQNLTSQLFVSSQPLTDELHSQHFQSSAEDEDDDDEDDFFMDKEYVRDDFYLDHRKSRRQSRENFSVQFRRGRGRPPGSRRTYFDAVRTVSTRSHTVD